jgi:hypothetical protein
MRRLVAAMMEDGSSDERALQFDVCRLEPGDQVEVFMEAERYWSRGTLQISTAGDALIELQYRQTISFDRALAMGLRRVLH